MNVKVDSKVFAGVLTAYEFEGKWKEKNNPQGRLMRAEILTDGEVAEGNENRVFLYYEKEAHAFTLKEVADFLGVERVVIGSLGKNMNVLCLIAIKARKDGCALLLSQPCAYVWFNNKRYRTWTLDAKGEKILVAEVALQTALMNEDGTECVSEGARVLDEQIAYYADEDETVEEVISAYLDKPVR